MSALIVAAFVTPAWADDGAQLRAQIEQLTAQLKSIQAEQARLLQKMEQTDQTVATQAEKTKVVEEKAAAEKKRADAAPPGSFMIPGTDTSMKIGGYIKLDVVDDLSGANNNGPVTDMQSIAIKGTPQSKRQNQFAMTARQSRLNVGTETPTAYGPLKSFIEGDFYGTGSSSFATNSASFRLRHANFSLGNVLVGQSWTNFEDLEVIPETLDFGGTIGVPYGLRQGQIRYTTSLFGKDSLSVSVENPEGDFFGADHGSFIVAGQQNSTRVLNQVPDITARYVHKSDWGRFSLAGVAREINLDTGGASSTFLNNSGGTFNFRGSASTWGGGLMASAQFLTFGKDTLTFWLGGGPGIGRYFQQTQDEAFTIGQSPYGAANANPGGGAVLDTKGDLHTITSAGGNVWYRHYWNDSLRSNATFGMTRHYNDSDYLPINMVRQVQSMHLNLIWSPLPKTNFGIEYIWAKMELNGQTPANRALGYGTSGTMNRVQLSAQYIF